MKRCREWRGRWRCLLLRACTRPFRYTERFWPIQTSGQGSSIQDLSNASWPKTVNEMLLPRLYAILDAGCFQEVDAMAAAAGEIVTAGCTLIQYRNKSG